jgi:tripartite-type tricarboxylate transporter receptor subunit TctC
MAESGYPDIEFDNWFGVFVPAGTYDDITTLINREIIKTMTLPDVRARLELLGFDPVGSTPADFRRQIEAELEKWGKVILAGTIKAQD